MSKLLEQINSKSKVGSIKDLVFPVSNTYNFVEKDKVIFINTGDIFEGKFLHHNYSPVKKLPGQAKKIIKQGDILFSEIRPKNKHFALVDFDSKDYVVSTKLIVLKVKESIDPKYAYIVLTADQNLMEFQNIAESRSGTFPQITFESIADYEVSIPDLPTQKKIASILGAYDEKIENNNKIIKNLEETAQTIFNEWFINFKFPGDEKVKMVDSEMGEIPEGWEISSLGEISNNHDSKRRPLSSMERAKRKGKIPYYGANGVLDYIDESIFSGEYILFAEDGTVKTDKGTPVIYLVDADFWVNNHAHIISGKSVSNYYIYLSLRTINVDPYITGGVQPKITQQNLNSIPVIVPDNEIKKRFEVFISSIFRKIRMAEKENVSLKSQRDLLLAKLI